MGVLLVGLTNQQHTYFSLKEACKVHYHVEDMTSGA